jgi:hypothetical protein
MGRHNAEVEGGERLGWIQMSLRTMTLDSSFDVPDETMFEQRTE